MRTPVGLRRPEALPVVSVVVLALILGGALHVPVAKGPPAPCLTGTLDPVAGHLARWGDAILLENATWSGHAWWRLALNLPEGWTVRTGDGDTLEIVKASGAVVARTGTPVAFHAANGGAAMAEPVVHDSVLDVCP